MPRLIDADEMMEYINSSINAMTKTGVMVDGEYLWGLLNDAIDNAPTVDAETVVRCKDCANNYHNMIPSGEAEYACTKCIELPITADFYCAKGVRMENAETD